MATDRRRTDRRFVQLMYLQWIVAVVLAAWYTPRTALGQTVRTDVLLLVSFTSAGICTLCATLAVRYWRGRRRCRLAVAVCQMAVSVLYLLLTDCSPEAHFHIYGSLAFLAFYADWAVLLVASATVVNSAVLAHFMTSPFTPRALSYAHIVAEAAWILLCDIFLLWSGKGRAREALQLFQQRRRQNDLLHRAFHDRRSGLPNRASLEASMDELLGRNISLSCLYLEVEGVHSAYELLDAEGGDAVLQSVVSRLQVCLDGQDILGRLGEDRFLVLLQRPHARPQLASLAERLVQTLQLPHATPVRTLATSTSIGIASAPHDGNSRDTLLQAAERAMVVARHEGRDSFRFAENDHNVADQRRLLLAGKLQRALLEGGLHLFFQPIYTRGEQMAAVEALARWRDAEEGDISPAEFVPVAEMTGLIVPMSNWVLREACKQMRAWKDAGMPLDRVAVNISVKQAWRSDFVPAVERTLREAGLPANCLELEITEGALATDFDLVKQNMQRLRAMGVRISIDDFGTGYSSLSRVRELEADVLKIDRAFVQSATESENGAAVVRAVMEMAHSLHLEVIAEGVETAEQLKLLRNMGFDGIQGYLLARPQSAEALTTRFQAQEEEYAKRRGLQLVPRTA